MLVVACVIAPVFAAFQKIVTGKSTIYQNWFKEIMYIVFLQSLHVIAYAILLTISMNMIGEGVISSIFMLFIIAQIVSLPKKMTSAVRTFRRNIRR